MSSLEFDVMVIGGGIVGMSAALAAHQHGYSVVLLDGSIIKTNTQGIDPRVYAINHASQQLFETLGVWQNMDQSCLSPYQHMHVWDSVNGAKIDFDTRMIGVDRLGTIIEESIIKQALIQRLSKEKIPIYSEHRVIEVKSEVETIVINDNHNNTCRAKLMIVADGANSSLRQLLGVSLTSWPYHQQAIVTTVATEKPHCATAYQVFNPDGPLAFLPLVNQQQCSIVWSTTTMNAQKRMQQTDEVFASELAAAFAHRLGACQVIGKRYQFPLFMRHTKQYVGQRWIIMGDAAHTIHPLAGLGLNVGLSDVSTWIGALKSNKSDTAKLAAYQRQRKAEVWQLILFIESLKAIFANPLQPLTSLRGLGLQACDRLTPIKRWLIQQATGQ